ncbi:uncharacterized protein DS421_18g628910 [Arachis hypogaea]|nr:uncharacterized protein DS421_18g628910 [Arachis hypogaea]
MQGKRSYVRVETPLLSSRLLAHHGGFQNHNQNRSLSCEIRRDPGIPNLMIDSLRQLLATRAAAILLKRTAWKTVEDTAAWSLLAWGPSNLMAAGSILSDYESRDIAL